MKFFKQLAISDIVEYLIDHGADILRANYNGGTCLINSVQSVELCTLLLKHGVDVNARDLQNKTALHYAIQEHRLETIELLLANNADPHLISRYQDDALQTACLKGATHIFDYLGKPCENLFFFFLSRSRIFFLCFVLSLQWNIYRTRRRD